MAKMLPELKSSPVVHRCQDGAPVLSKQDIPYEAGCIFNCGVGAFAHCVIGLAFSRDGIRWKVREKPFIRYPFTSEGMERRVGRLRAAVEGYHFTLRVWTAPPQRIQGD